MATPRGAARFRDPLGDAHQLAAGRVSEGRRGIGVVVFSEDDAGRRMAVVPYGIQCVHCRAGCGDVCVGAEEKFFVVGCFDKISYACQQYVFQVTRRRISAGLRLESPEDRLQLFKYNIQSQFIGFMKPGPAVEKHLARAKPVAVEHIPV